jgi:hypothetical protein
MLGGSQRLRFHPHTFGEASMKDQKGKSQGLTTEVILKGLKRAAKEARRQAKIHGTKVWVMIDGKVVGLKP